MPGKQGERRAISQLLIDQVWDEMIHMPEDQAHDWMLAFMLRQQELVTFVMGAAGEMSEKASMHANFLLVNIYRMFEMMCESKPPFIGLSDLQQRHQVYLDRLIDFPSMVKELAAASKGQSPCQPHLCKFLADYFSRQDDKDEISLNSMYGIALFLILKTVIETLDAACFPAGDRG